VESHVAVVHEAAAAGGGVGNTSTGNVGGGSKGSKKDNASTVGGSVHGSILSRDLNTTYPQAMQMEVSRMISTFDFLKQSTNTLLRALEYSTKVAIGSDRTNDQFRWREVRRVMEEGPTAKMMSCEGFAASSC